MKRERLKVMGMKKRKRIILVACMALIAGLLGGCGMLGEIDEKDQMDTIVNGTSTGNIINWGYAAAYDIYLYLFSPGGDESDLGDIVKTDMTTGESSLAIKDGGLYLSIVDTYLYYCGKDGIYRAPLDTLVPELLYQGETSLLQFAGERMYFLEDETIRSTTMDGAPWGFAPIDGAKCVNVTDEGLYHINTLDGKIYRSELDGTETQLHIDQAVDLFCIFEDTLYFIDSASGYILSVALTEPVDYAKVIIQHRCSNLNMNQYGLYYTRIVDGESKCCRADLDGTNEQVFKESGVSARHLVCVFNESALIVEQEKYTDWWE